MSLGFAVSLFRSGLVQVLLMAAPALLIGVGVGLLVSIFQATTSIQDQTLSFVPKIAAILGSLILFGPWIFGSLSQYTENLYNMIPQMAR
jgi:flagellar biosynthetic protein FliQ